MKNNYEVKKCLKCGAMVEVLYPCTCENCGIKCCGEVMQTLRANSVDASFEKHLPVYEVKGNKILARVPHVMEEDHYIDYIVLETNDSVLKQYLKIGEEAKAEFPYVKGSKLFAYCNKHGIWCTEVE